MKILKIKIIALSTAFLLGGCSYSKMTHSDYMNYDGMWKSMLYKTEHQVKIPLKTVIQRLQARKTECLPSSHTTVYKGVTPRINKVKTTITIKKISSKNFEYSVQVHHSDTMMQPKDGFFSVASDITSLGTNITNLKITGMDKEWANRVISWAEGKTGCLGW